MQELNSDKGTYLIIAAKVQAFEGQMANKVVIS